MDTLLLMLLYWGVFFFFYGLARRFGTRLKNPGYLDKGMTVMIVILVFTMGLRMGANEEVISNLGQIGLQAICITLATIGGSIGFVLILRRLFRVGRDGRLTKDKMESEQENARCISEEKQTEMWVKEKAETEDKGKEEKENRNMTLLILLSVTIGMALGYGAVPVLFSDLEGFHTKAGDILVLGICILLALVGFNLGLSGGILENLKNAGLRVILFPLAAITGSLAGGAVYGMLSTLSVGEGVAISAGFGWYTLAPSMITEAGHMVAGAVSFLHNVIREVLGIIMIPAIAGKIGCLEAVAVPGVAATDICIPIVKKACGEDIIPYSFATGMLMCVAVPVIVPLALS